MSHAPRLRTALSLAACLLAALPAAQAAIYVDLRPAVSGLSTRPGYSGWADAYSVQWGAGVGISHGPGGTQVSAPSLSEITWTQRGDSTLPSLMLTTLAGTVMPTTQIDLLAANPSGRAYLALDTEQSVITGLSQSAGGGDISVSASLGYAKFAMSYDPAGFGQAGPAVTTSYDLVTKTATGPTTRAPQAVASGSPAAAGIYMRLGNGANVIAGEETSNGYLNWINLSSYQFGVGLSYDPISGMVSQPSISEVTVTQTLDATIPAVFGNLLRGNSIGQVTLEFVTTGPAGPVTTMQMALNDVRFSGLTFSSGGDVASVSESLNFTSFSQTAWPLLADGTRGTPTSTFFNMLTGQSGPGMQAENVAGFGNGNLDAVPVPEPQTWALMLAGAGLLLGVARRRAARRG